MEYKYVGVGKGIKKQAGNKNKNILYQFFKKASKDKNDRRREQVESPT